MQVEKRGIYKKVCCINMLFSGMEIEHPTDIDAIVEKAR